MKTGDELRAAALAFFAHHNAGAMVTAPILAEAIGADDFTELEAILAHPIKQGQITVRRMGAAVWFGVGIPEPEQEPTHPDDYDAWPVRQVVGVEARPGCAIECGGLARKDQP